MRVLAIAAGLWALVLAAPAGATGPCPAGYFEATSGDAPIVNTSSSFDATLCISIVTSRSRIEVKLVGLVHLANARELAAHLQQTLMASSGGSSSCSQGNSSFGWLAPSGNDLNLSQLRVFFVRTSPESSSIHAVATIADRGGIVGFESRAFGTITADAPLIVSRSASGLRLSLGRPTVRSTMRNFLLPREAIADRIQSCVDQALAGYNFDAGNVVPEQASTLRQLYQVMGPQVDGARLMATPEELSLSVRLSGSLSKAAADRVMRDATRGWSVEQFINFLKGGTVS